MSRKRGRQDARMVALASTPAPAGASIARLSSDDFARLREGQFYERFVATRTPCIIDCLLPDSELTVSAWTLEGMATRARATDVVSLEHRDARTSSFGTGVKTSMPLRDALKTIASGGREDLYLTTQPIEDSADGFPRYLYAQPLTSMEGTFSLRPSLMGGLLPANINVWAGCSRSGSSSNLHHDFHDNLYILLQGRKVFTIASPAYASRMYTHGTITRVHPSGIINYRGLSTRADGYVVDDADADVPVSVTAHAKPSKRSKNAAAAASGSTADDMWAALEAEAATLRLPTAASRTAVPDHFSRINLPQLRAELQTTHAAARAGFSALDAFARVQQHPGIARDFPDFLHVPLATFQLRAGQMLFLPAGWFHEVVSFSEEHGTDVPSPHLALNYWFYPPAGADPSHPYADDSWARVHAAMQTAHAVLTRDRNGARSGAAASRRGGAEKRIRYPAASAGQVGS